MRSDPARFLRWINAKTADEEWTALHYASFTQNLQPHHLVCYTRGSEKMPITICRIILRVNYWLTTKISIASKSIGKELLIIIQ